MRSPRNFPPVTPERFRAVALGALAAMTLIVVTGGAVRVTGSGLGCSSWPNCEPGRLIAPPGYHQWVEFGNRLVSAAVVITVVLTLLAAVRRTPPRRDLTLLSAGLVAGVVAQVVLGGITVYFDLRPPLVMAHFLLSMLLVLDATVLHWRAGRPDNQPDAQMAIRRDLVWLTRALAAVGAVVLLFGTVVTGTGPHSGDKRSARFGFDLHAVTELHTDAVMVLTGLTLAAGVLLAVTEVSRSLRRHYLALVAIVVAQATVGFTQYALHLPAGLVELHILGATLFWIAAVRLALVAGSPVAVPEEWVDQMNAATATTANSNVR
jgi:cytochrome c oxidase assembly protein subunit 15